MRKCLISLLFLLTLFGIAAAQSLNASQAKLRDEIKAFLQEEGFMPSIENGGEISFKKEGTTYWISVSPEDINPMFVTIGVIFGKPQEYTLTTMMLAAADLNLYKGIKVLCGEDSFAVEGEMFLGNAEQFKYAFYTLMGQIEKALLSFNDVCKQYNNESTASSSRSSSAIAASNRDSNSSEPKVIYYPSIRSTGDNRLIFKRVIIADSYTALEMSTSNKYEGGYYTWCQIAKGAHLICGGKHYAMKKADGIKVAPDKTYFANANSTLDFTLYFEPIPKNATSIDFYEDAGSSWNTWGISLTESGTSSNRSNSSNSSSTQTRSTSSSGTKTTASSGVKRTAKIESVNVDHNVIKDGVKGMKIHVKFNIQNCKGENCRCIAYFMYEDGKPVKDTNNQYKDAGGNVSTGADFSPGYDNTTYKDLELWIPNEELHINTSSGKVNCYFLVQLYDFDISEFVEASYKVSFTIG